MRVSFGIANERAWTSQPNLNGTYLTYLGRYLDMGLSDFKLQLLRTRQLNLW